MNIIEIENFISDQEASELISLATIDLKKSGTLGKNSPNDYRIAEDAFIRDSKSSLIKSIRCKLSNTVHIPVSHMECMDIVKYNIGGLYDAHHDFFHPNTDYYDECMSDGGQRIKSALIYLNDNFEGGETVFPTLKRKIVPKLGKLVIWDNVDENGNLLYESLHAGLSVISGIKYIGIIWIREKELLK